MPRAKPNFQTITDTFNRPTSTYGFRPGNVQAPRPNSKIFDETGRYLGTVIEWEVSTSDPWACEPTTQLKLANIGADYPYPFFIPAPTDEVLYRRHMETSMFTTKTRTNINDDVVVEIYTQFDGSSRMVYESDPITPGKDDSATDIRDQVQKEFLAHLRQVLDPSGQ